MAVPVAIATPASHQAGRAVAVVPGDDRPGGAPATRPIPTARYERALLREGLVAIAGVDEVGRGCLAGPVVAAAVVLPPSRFVNAGVLRAARDSKQLRPDERERLNDHLARIALARGVGVVPARTIDELGIAPATRLAMRQAIDALGIVPDHVLIDFVRLPELPLAQTPIVDGDALCLSIAAASIVAKVARDRLMVAHAREHPSYGFENHKGYGTPEHLAALARLGPSELHRATFAPVRGVLGDAPSDVVAATVRVADGAP